MSELKRRALIVAFALLVLAVLIWRPWRSAFRYHFGFALPTSATYINYHHSWGLDSGDEFAFQVNDDALRDAIIKEWNLKPAVRDEDIISFASFGKDSWWPAARLKNLPERYSRIDQSTAHYWSLWVDREHGGIFVEYGDW